MLKLAHGKANTMDVELCQAVIDEFKQLRAPPVQAVVLSGQGGMFSAGVDLVRTSGGPDYVRKFLPVLNAMFDAVFHFPNRWWRRSTGMPSRAAACWRVAPTGV